MPINQASARARKRRLSLRGALLVAPLLGAAPIACLSDVTLPECVQHHTCGGSGGQLSEAGSPDQSPGAGSLGRSATLSGAGDAAGGSSSGGSGTNEAGAGGADPCPTCVSPFQLPDPCGNNPYTGALHIIEGKAPFQWAVSAPVGSWQVTPDAADSSRATLSGTPNGVENVTIVVTDHVGRVFQKVYSLSPRSACYFAYIASDTRGDPKLNLRDPLLQTPAPITFTNNQSVYDFRFSPSGRFLVYRFQDTSGNPVKSHLSLVDLSIWKDYPLAFGEDVVTAYTWSSDSRFLAVAFNTGQVTHLGGAQITLGATPTTAARLDVLTPVVSSAPAESGLFWLGTSFVAFYATEPTSSADTPAWITPFSAQLDAGGFAAPVPNTDDQYLAPVTLQPADVGFFMIVGDLPGTGFHAVAADAFSGEHDSDIVAPSGRFTAGVSSGQLQVFQAQDSDFLSGPIATSADCGRLLTWASGRERIACVSNVSDADAGTMHGDIHFFDLSLGGSVASLTSSKLNGSCDSPIGDAPANAPCPASGYDYTEESAKLQPRLFSPSGRWLAFTTNTQQPEPGNPYLYWADLAGQSPTIQRRDLINPGADQTSTRNVLAFSPDERYLLLQSGSMLSLHLLAAPQSTGVTSNPIVIANDMLPPAASADCSEDFGTAPRDWCGAANRVSSFVWAPDSKRIAYRTADHLAVIDQFSVNNWNDLALPNSACAGTLCSAEFAFQPQP